MINTDAEGRLTLADALVFAEKLEVDAIVDMATLTGACMVALGEKYAGMWSPDEDLAKALEASSEATGDTIWRMPLCEAEYGPDIKSKVGQAGHGGRAGQEPSPMGNQRWGERVEGHQRSIFLTDHLTKPTKPFYHLITRLPTSRMLARALGAPLPPLSSLKSSSPRLPGLTSVS